MALRTTIQNSKFVVPDLHTLKVSKEILGNTSNTVFFQCISPCCAVFSEKSICPRYLKLCPKIHPSSFLVLKKLQNPNQCLLQFALTWPETEEKWMNFTNVPVSFFRLRTSSQITIQLPTSKRDLTIIDTGQHLNFNKAPSNNENYSQNPLTKNFLQKQNYSRNKNTPYKHSVSSSEFPNSSYCNQNEWIHHLCIYCLYDDVYQANQPN